MTAIQTKLAALSTDIQTFFVPTYGDVATFYTVVYLIARNGHLTEQEKPEKYELRLEMIRSVRTKIEDQLTAWGLDGEDMVADIVSDYFEDFVNYREQPVALTNEIFVSIIQKVMKL